MRNCPGWFRQTLCFGWRAKPKTMSRRERRYQPMSIALLRTPIPNPKAPSGPPEGFFGWVTQLVHTHRARLSRLVVREGVRAEDALDCVQEAFLSFLQLPQARLLVGSQQESARLLSTLARNIARNRRRRHDYA